MNDVQKLIVQLDHPHTSKRLEAIESLAQRGPTVKPYLSALVLKLVDFDPRVRQEAEKTLVVIDNAWWTEDFVVKPVIPQLVVALGKSPTREPLWAHSVLVKIGRSAVPELAKALLDDRDDVLQVWAARTLGSIGAEAGEAAAYLGKALHHTKVHIREAATKALAELGVVAEPAISDLVEALLDKHPPVRAAAACALQRIGPTASIAIPQLLNLLSDHMDDIRKSAMDALAAMSTKAVPSLIRILEDRTLCLSEAFRKLLYDMVKILDRVDPSAIGHHRVESYRNLMWHFKYAFDKSPERLHEAVTIVLGMIGPEAKDAIPVLVEMSKDENSLLRSEAIRALVRIDPEAEMDLENLPKAGMDKAPQSRSYDVDLLSEIDPDLLNMFHFIEFINSLPRKCINTNDRESAIKLLRRVAQVVTQVEETVLIREAAEKALRKMIRGRPRSKTVHRPHRRGGFGFGGSR